MEPDWLDWENAGKAAAKANGSTARRAQKTQVFMKANNQQKALTGFPASA
ncbi:hypothetical protein [Polaromonas sp.]